MTNDYLIASSSPHIKSKDTTKSIMRDVLIALAPAAIFAIYHFGLNAFLLIIACVASCVATEYILQTLTKRKVTIGDLSAAVTGVLLAFNLPPTLPIWMAVVGSVFAIFVVKFIFGGIGRNIVNPALCARAFLLACYPANMTNFQIDAITGPTPLEILKSNSATAILSFKDAILGFKGGCIGEVSAILLIVGAIYLVIRRVITLETPLSYIIVVLIFSLISNRTNGFFQTQSFFNGAYEIFAGGLMLGAFFMATDYTTSPMTRNGKIIFGIGCGIITSVIRLMGGYAEGVSYSILLMNLLVPFIDKFTPEKIYGGIKNERKS